MAAQYIVHTSGAAALLSCAHVHIAQLHHTENDGCYLPDMNFADDGRSHRSDTRPSSALLAAIVPRSHTTLYKTQDGLLSVDLLSTTALCFKYRLHLRRCVEKNTWYKIPRKNNALVG